MNKFLMAAVLVTATTGFAQAADPIMDPPIIEAPVMDWSGFYAGAQVGYGVVNVNRLVLPAGFANSYTAAGWLLGVHAGANVQQDMFVFGVEADANWSGINGNDAGAGGTTDTTDVNWISTFRGRVGIAAGQALFYGTAGLAAAGVTNSNPTVPAQSISNTHFGWTAGLGIEIAVMDNIRIRGQYLYADLGTQTYNFTNVAPASSSLTSHTGTIGISFGF